GDQQTEEARQQVQRQVAFLAKSGIDVRNLAVHERPAVRRFGRGNGTAQRSDCWSFQAMAVGRVSQAGSRSFSREPSSAKLRIKTMSSTIMNKAWTRAGKLSLPPASVGGWRGFWPLLGPIFVREWLTVPRRARHYVTRCAYFGLLWVLALTAWQATVGWDRVATIGDTSRFGLLLFEILVLYVQLPLLLFFAALS